MVTRDLRGMATAVAVVLAAVMASGCSVKLVKRSQADTERLAALSQEVDTLRELNKQQGQETDSLRTAKQELEAQLAKEIADKQVSVGLNDRGLVITFLAEILFDSGKAKIRREAQPVLDKVAKVLNADVPNQQIGIEGHTDNEPIKRSGWKSNWELSTARAISVLHYIVDEKDVAPQRVSAIGYGEYRPVTANDTKEGRQQNRRVEIVVLPQQMTKVKAQAAKADTAAVEAPVVTEGSK